MTDNLNKKTLFICDLDPTITERQLTSAFKEEGYSVNYIRINKSKYPNGLNTAFVNFEDEKDAEKALANLNHLTLGRTELFIVYATNKPTGAQFKYPIDKTVYVKGLPKTIETVILIKIFSSMFGEVENLRVMRNEKNESRGYGYITFKDPADAKKAIAHDKDQEMKFEINGEKYTFQFEFMEYVSREYRQQNWTNTYIRDYPNDWNKEKLEEFAKRTGETKSVVSNFKPELGLTYGFADFSNHADAEKFLTLSGKTIDKTTLMPIEGDVPPGAATFKPYINKYTPKNVFINQRQMYRQQGYGIFITDFGDDIVLKDINDEFSKYGTIYSFTLYKNPIHEILPGADPRFPRALVIYENKEGPMNAIAQANNARTLNGKPLEKPLFVAGQRTRGTNNYAKNKERNNGRNANYNYNNNNNNQYRSNNQYRNNNYNKQNTGRGINDYQPDQFFDNNNNKPQIQQQAQPTHNAAELENVIRKYLEANTADQLDKIPRILDIFTQMLNEEEIQQCISNQNHIADYITAILDEM